MNKLKLFSATLLATLILPTTSVFAEIQTDTINELWGKPTVVYGGGVTESDLQDLNKIFNIKNMDNVNKQVVGSEDFEKYLSQSIDSKSLFSSVLVQKKTDKSGVVVNIKTPQNITKITKTQYENAAITAGATDVEIEVAANKSVTGESALVGVYKALELNGEVVDLARTEIAQEELATASEITQNNTNDSKFDSTLLDNALIQIKTKLAEEKQKTNDVVSEEQVTEIVNQALKDNGLDGIISPTDVQSLVDFANKFQNSSAADSKEILNQLGNLESSIKDKASELLDNVQNSGFLDSIGDFFNKVWSFISGWFSGQQQ